MDINLNGNDAMIIGDVDVPFEEPEIVTKKRKVLSEASKVSKLAYQLKARREKVTGDLKKEVYALKKKIVPSNRFHLTRGVDYNADDESASDGDEVDKSCVFNEFQTIFIKIYQFPKFEK